MPRLSTFFGIVITMYYDDVGKHSAPHFHARYAEFEAVFSIPEAEVLAGHLPRRQMRLVQGWGTLYSESLERAWADAIGGRPLAPIPPLSQSS